MILHGLHCGYRDVQRLPTDKDRISRHYYDVAMITAKRGRQVRIVKYRPAGCGPEPQPHRLPAGLETVRRSRSRIGEIGSTG